MYIIIIFIFLQFISENFKNFIPANYKEKIINVNNNQPNVLNNNQQNNNEIYDEQINGLI